MPSPSGNRASLEARPHEKPEDFILSLDESYHYCEAVAKREAGNFYPAFRILPRAQRLAMCALYAFMRVSDDLGDANEPVDVRRRNLAAWRTGLHGALLGDFTHPGHPALADIVERYRIPTEYLEAAIDGMEMDLGPVAYQTFDELRLYCYRVASVVGLACIHIWGFTDASALRHAEEAGIAFQLTNILRDLREDAARGRVYLPAEDLRRFGYDPAGFATGQRDDAFRALMRFEIARADGCYEASRALTPLLMPPGRAVFLMMSRTYRELLRVIESRDYDVFSRRIRVPAWKKLWFGIRVVPVRLGWRAE